MTAIGRARATEQWQREEGRYIPNPATWLNQGRWDDEYEEVTQPYGSNSQHSRFKLAWEEDDNDAVINKQHTGPNKAGGFALSGFQRAEDAEWFNDDDADEPKKQDEGTDPNPRKPKRQSSNVKPGKGTYSDIPEELEDDEEAVKKEKERLGSTLPVLKT